jgi:hypothetical protein
MDGRILGLVAPTSAFGSGSPSDRALVNRVHVGRAGPRKVPEQHRGVRETPSFIRLEPGAASTQEQHADGKSELRNHGMKTNWISLKFGSSGGESVIGLVPFVKGTEAVGPDEFLSVTSKWTL